MTTAKKSAASSNSNDRAEIRIGVSDSAREITIESTLSANDVEALVDQSTSLANASSYAMILEPLLDTMLNPEDPQ